MKGQVMIQGTASSVGKSVICAALCRILHEDGYSVAPFKSQNMALNSYVTSDGLEMGRAQVMQAEAAGIEPVVDMNPVLLKPNTNNGSQVIVMGRPIGNMDAAAYFSWKEELLPVIDQAYGRLASKHDFIVIEGAGSPAEINLKKGDFVNMGLAKRLAAPVILVGDIDRGGVFASIYGTIALLSEEERKLIKGVIINKFRGDRKVLEPGLEELEQLINLPVLGVIPMLKMNLDDEDSLTERFSGRDKNGSLEIKVIMLPRISNFTDFNPFELFEDLSFSYISSPEELGSPDLVILPGSKNTISDLLDLKERGWERPLENYVREGGLLTGICGGFQMLGEFIHDPGMVESEYTSIRGLGFIEMETTLESEKTTRQLEALWNWKDNNYFSLMKGDEIVRGYEIHMGQTIYGPNVHPLTVIGENRSDGAINEDGNVFGTYMHGIFDNLEWTGRIVNALRKKKGLPLLPSLKYKYYNQYKEQEFSRLASAVRENLDMERFYSIVLP